MCSVIGKRANPVTTSAKKVQEKLASTSPDAPGVYLFDHDIPRQ